MYQQCVRPASNLLTVPCAAPPLTVPCASPPLAVVPARALDRPSRHTFARRFSKILTWQSAALGPDNIGTIMGVYALGGAIGRAFGPIIAGPILQIYQRSGDPQNCDAIELASWFDSSWYRTSNNSCPVPSYYADNYCCTTSLKYFCVEGCMLTNSNTYIIVSLLLGVGLIVFNCRLVHCLTPYESAQDPRLFGAIRGKIVDEQELIETPSATRSESGHFSPPNGGSDVGDVHQDGEPPLTTSTGLSIGLAGVFGIVVAVLVASSIGNLGAKLDALTNKLPSVNGYSFGSMPTVGPSNDKTQTGLGVFALPNRVPPVCMGSRYFQDTKRQLLRIDAGFPNDPNWQTAPGFMLCANASGTTYISGQFDTTTTSLNGTKVSTLHCHHDHNDVDSWTYRRHVDTYSEARLPWLLNTSLNNVPAMAFAGVVPVPGAVNGRNETLISYSYAEEPNLLLGFDVMNVESNGLTRYFYHDTLAESRFDDYAGLDDCASLCDKTHDEAMALMKQNADVGLDAKKQHCG